MNEATKAMRRRLRDPQFASTYFVGRGLDVGAGADGLSRQRAQFPNISDVRDWDLGDGDGQELAGVGDCEFDFVHSSHSLEHMRDPVIALRRWLDVTVPGGFVIVLLPDEDLYEQGVWPSTYNPDHKHTFTVWKQSSWSPVSINVLDLIQALGQDAELVRLELLDGLFCNHLPRRDQTLGPSESAIEFILRRRR